MAATPSTFSRRWRFTLRRVLLLLVITVALWATWALVVMPWISKDGTGTVHREQVGSSVQQ
jgi:hypothetical protein